MDEWKWGMEWEWKENDSYVAPIINDARSVFRYSSINSSDGDSGSSNRSVIKTVQCTRIIHSCWLSPHCVSITSSTSRLVSHQSTRIHERTPHRDTLTHTYARIRTALLPPSMSLSLLLPPLLLLLADTLESTLSNQMHDTYWKRRHW